MDIRKLSLSDLTVKCVSHPDTHIARKLANQECDRGWHIATLPDIIRWRLDKSDSPESKRKMNTGWCLTDTEEYVVMTPEDRNEILVIHGGAFFPEPGKVQQLSEAMWDRGLELDLADSYYLRAGINANMKSLDMFPYHLFLELDKQFGLPSRYGVRIDEEHMVNRPNGWFSIDSFYDHPLFIARCGGKELSHAYLDALDQLGETTLQFRHEFDRRGENPFGYIVQTLGIEKIFPFFCEIQSMMQPHYLVAKEKQFKEHDGGYRDAPQRS